MQFIAVLQLSILFSQIKYGYCHGPGGPSGSGSSKSGPGGSGSSKSGPGGSGPSRSGPDGSGRSDKATLANSDSKQLYPTTESFLITTELSTTTKSNDPFDSEITNQPTFPKNSTYACYHNGTHWLLNITTWCENDIAWYNWFTAYWFIFGTSSEKSDEDEIAWNRDDQTADSDVNESNRVYKFRLFKWHCLHKNVPLPVFWANNRTLVILNSTRFYTNKALCNFDAESSVLTRDETNSDVKHFESNKTGSLEAADGSDSSGIAQPPPDNTITTTNGITKSTTVKLNFEPTSQVYFVTTKQPSNATNIKDEYKQTNASLFSQAYFNTSSLKVNPLNDS